MSEERAGGQDAPDLKTREILVAEERLRLDKACAEREYRVKLRGQLAEIGKWVIGGLFVLATFWAVDLKEQRRLDKQFMLETHRAMLGVMETSDFDSFRRKLSYLEVVANTLEPDIKVFVQTLHRQLADNERKHGEWVNATMTIAGLAAKLDNATTAQTALLEAASQGPWKSLLDISNDAQSLAATSSVLTASKEAGAALNGGQAVVEIGQSHIPVTFVDSALSYVNATTQEDILKKIQEVAKRRADLGMDLKSAGLEPVLKGQLGSPPPNQGVVAHR